MRKMNKKKNQCYQFITKADTLKFLKTRIKKSKIEKLLDFTISEWNENEKNIVREISKKVGFKIKHIEHIGCGIPIWKLDSVFRRHEIFDDMFESVGKRLFYKQATSLYVIMKKE